MPEDVQGLSEDDHVYVIDSGSLLHRIPWQKGRTYNKIFKWLTEANDWSALHRIDNNEC